MFLWFSQQDFFDLLIVYYKCDAGSYTEDSGGEKALDHLFIFDSTRGKLNFSFSVKSKVRKLQKFVLENWFIFSFALLKIKLRLQIVSMKLL